MKGKNGLIAKNRQTTGFIPPESPRMKACLWGITLTSRAFGPHWGKHENYKLTLVTTSPTEGSEQNQPQMKQAPNPPHPYNILFQPLPIK